MGSKRKIALLGGDLRQVFAAKQLAKKGWEPVLWGLDGISQNTDFPLCESCEEAVCGAVAIVLPLPASKDGETLNCPFEKQAGALSLCRILEKAEPQTVIVGGKIPQSVFRQAKEKGLSISDYFESEEFQIQNAYITAEAALSLAMRELPKTVRGAKTAVIGYGRIAKNLAALLGSVGADVTVAARRDSDLAWAELSGFRTLKIGSDTQKGEWYRLCHGYDVFFNTVPTWIFEEDFLEKLDKSTLLIDLAPVPGVHDVKDIRLIRAAALPGQYAPQSAGILVGNFADRILWAEVNAK